MVIQICFTNRQNSVMTAQQFTTVPFVMQTTTHGNWRMGLWDSRCLYKSQFNWTLIIVRIDSIFQNIQHCLSVDVPSYPRGNCGTYTHQPSWASPATTPQPSNPSSDSDSLHQRHPKDTPSHLPNNHASPEQHLHDKLTRPRQNIPQTLTLQSLNPAQTDLAQSDCTLTCPYHNASPSTHVGP